jgi:hypothetical protein
MVKQALFIAVCVAELGLQACGNSAADPATVEAEVQRATAVGEKRIADAQATLEQVAAENKKDVVVAQADARIDAANAGEAEHPADAAKKSGTKKIDATEPAAQLPADENVAKTRIAAMQKVADAHYAVDKAQAEATYGVTLARCKGQASQDMQAVCRDGAEKTLASSVANAKARNDAARRRATLAQGNGQNG